jgi:hypothetical protein
MAIQEANRELTHAEVDQASETLHHVIDSGRQMFRAGERVIDELDHLWQTTKRVNGGGGQGSRQRRLWIIGIMAGVCLAIAARVRAR